MLLTRRLKPRKCLRNTWGAWSQERGTIAPPSPGRHGTSFTFLQFLHKSVTYVAFALVLEAAITIPEIFTSFEIYCACKYFYQDKYEYIEHYIQGIMNATWTHLDTKKVAWGDQLTPSDRIDTGSCSDFNSTCTSPGTGSSISPVSPWTLVLRPARTSAAAFSNWFVFHTAKESSISQSTICRCNLKVDATV